MKILSLLSILYGWSAFAEVVHDKKDMPSSLVTKESSAKVFKIDASHTNLGFQVKHLMISKVVGNFKVFEGSFQFNPHSAELSKVNVQATVSSIDTNDAKRDEHLKSADFFDAAKFPNITFVSEKKIKAKKDLSFDLPGELNLHGVKKNIVAKVTYKGSLKDPWGNERVAFKVLLTVNRKDFGISWNKTLDAGGVMVGDEVDITFDGEGIVEKSN